MHDIKTNWRSSLCTESLNDLMRVYQDTSDIEFFYSMPAVTLWLKSDERKRKLSVLLSQNITKRINPLIFFSLTISGTVRR